MKFTVAEVLDSYLVLDDSTGERVTYYESQEANEETGEAEVLGIEWSSGGLDYSIFVKADQTVEAFGDTFTMTGTDGEKNDFRAYTIVRLNEVPEIR